MAAPPGVTALGVAALGDWASARKLDLEVVAQRRDVDGPAVDRALAIVRRFIVERGLILFGGLAIDYALRLKGSRLYPDDERPDFDVLSPRSVDDAYDLAERLRAAGFEGVGAVRGIHVQTMRVRASLFWVADIGYAPRDVFDRIPTLDYQGIRFVHPDFQRMDMHLAFCFPFNNPPLEDVFHRWRKDLKRFNQFEEFYPITMPPTRPSAAPRVVTARLAVPVAGAPRDLKVALHGFAAYSVLRTSLDTAAEMFGTDLPPADAPPTSPCRSRTTGPSPSRRRSATSCMSPAMTPPRPSPGWSTRRSTRTWISTPLPCGPGRSSCSRPRGGFSPRPSLRRGRRPAGRRSTS